MKSVNRESIRRCNKETEWKLRQRPATVWQLSPPQESSVFPSTSSPLSVRWLQLNDSLNRTPEYFLAVRIFCETKPRTPRHARVDA